MRLQKLQEYQTKDLAYNDRKRSKFKTYSEGEEIYVKINKGTGKKNNWNEYGN